MLTERLRAEGSAARVPETVHVRLPDWTGDTKPEAYLEMAEKLLAAGGIDESLWVGHLVSHLSEKAREVYARMATEDANKYRALKAEILNAYAVSACIYRRNFFSWTRESSQTYEEHSRALLEQLQRWFKGSKVELPQAVAELLVRYRIDQQLPPDLALFLVDKDTVSLADCVNLIDKHVLACKMLQVTQPRRTTEESAIKTAPRLPGGWIEGKGSPMTSTGGGREPQTRAGPWCDFCKRVGHGENRCFSNPASPAYRGNPPVKSEGDQWNSSAGPSHTTVASVTEVTATEVNSIHPLHQDYSGTALVGGPDSMLKFEAKYLRDTGATRCVLRAGVVPASQMRYTGEYTLLRGIDRVLGRYPLALLEVRSDIFKGPVTCVVVPYYPIPGVSLLIGNDAMAREESLTLTCGGVTRSQSKQAERVAESDISSLGPEEPSASTPVSDGDVASAEAHPSLPSSQPQVPCSSGTAPAMSRFSRNANAKVYVGNLGNGAARAELGRVFEHYGPLRNVWVARNPPGFAVVEFEDPRDAEDSVRALDGRLICGSCVCVEMSNGMSRRPRFRRPLVRRPFDSNDQCYQCGERGHYAYDCRSRHRRSTRRSRSRSVPLL
uniref:uncharacterized protein n=1 Tax=Myxine glutinosa TaxID=7769 RepID=UPI00358DF800